MPNRRRNTEKMADAWTRPARQSGQTREFHRCTPKGKVLHVRNLLPYLQGVLCRQAFQQLGEGEAPLDWRDWYNEHKDDDELWNDE